VSIRACIIIVAAACLTAGTASAAPPTIVAASDPGRVTRRTPQVMQEDAARIRRGDLFSTWSNAASN
jgi:hypothetical protein